MISQDRQPEVPTSGLVINQRVKHEGFGVGEVVLSLCVIPQLFSELLKCSGDSKRTHRDLERLWPPNLWTFLDQGTTGRRFGMGITLRQAGNKLFLGPISCTNPAGKVPGVPGRIHVPGNAAWIDIWPGCSWKEMAEEEEQPV